MVCQCMDILSLDIKERINMLRQDYKTRVKEVKDAIAILEAQGKEKFSAEINSFVKIRINVLLSNSTVIPGLRVYGNYVLPFRFCKASSKSFL